MAESTAEQLAREFQALNIATERAHRAIADMRQARADLRAECTRAEDLTEKLRTATAERADELIAAEFTEQFDIVLPKIKELLDGARAATERKFEEFADILLGRKMPPGQDLESAVMAAARRELRGLTSRDRAPRL